MSAKRQTEYVRKLQELLAFAYQTAQKAAQKAAERYKANYDLRVRPSGLQPGDRVLVRNVGLRGKHKLADRWERHPYVVKAQPNPDIPVYEVQLDNSRTRKTRTLHRNLLLPFSSLPPPPVEHSKSSATNSSNPISDAADLQSTLMDLSQIETEIPYSCVGNEDSDVGYDASISSSSQADATETVPVPRYIIPNKRKPGQPGLSPRTTASTITSESSSESVHRKHRPQQPHRKPSWMKPSEWVFSQQPHTFNVDRKDIVIL